MHESSLPVWMIILFVGVAISLSLGYFNPFLTKEDKKKIKEFRKKNAPDLKQGLTVKLRFHFAGTAYIVIMVLANLAALIAFFIESYSAFAASLGGGFPGYTFAFLGAIFGIPLAEGIFVVLSILIEQKTVRTTVAYYRRRGVEVLDDEWYN